MQDNLGVIDITIRPNGHLLGVRHTDQESEKGLTIFDLVISKQDKFVAIEISFQVITNSVIERKAGQARSRFEQIENAGYKMAYVIDGAGNFERENAIRTLCTYIAILNHLHNSCRGNPPVVAQFLGGRARGHRPYRYV